MNKQSTLKQGAPLGEIPSILLFEPVTRKKLRRLGQLVSNRLVIHNQDELKLHLKHIRSYSVDNINRLTEEFKQNISGYENTNVIVANEASDAVNYISRLVPDTKTIYFSNSSTTNELRPELIKNGYTLVDTYSAQFTKFKGIQKTINYPWQLPTTYPQSAWETFDCVYDIGRQPKPDRGFKDMVALLGVNAVSARDGTLCFLQHSSNISKTLINARRLFVVVGLEKIVPNKEDAIFQTKAVGMFGMESVILDLNIGDSSEHDTDHIAEIPEDSVLDRELHIILLDNQRTRIAKEHYRELLYCIGCRACGKECPAYRFVEEFTNYPKEYLWLFLLGSNPTIEWCIHCAICDFECPVGINLSKLIAKAKNEFSPYITSSLVNRILTNIPKLMPIGSLIAPAVNLAVHMRLLRIIIEKVVDIDRRRKMPIFHYKTFQRWFKSRHA